MTILKRLANFFQMNERLPGSFKPQLCAVGLCSVASLKHILVGTDDLGSVRLSHIIILNQPMLQLQPYSNVPWLVFTLAVEESVRMVLSFPLSPFSHFARFLVTDTFTQVITIGYEREHGQIKTVYLSDYTAHCKTMSCHLRTVEPT